MTRTLACGEVMPECSATFQGDTDEEVLAQAGQHAANDHGMTDLDENTVATIRGKIRDQS
jgi:predicted small metal-binding protein